MGLPVWSETSPRHSATDFKASMVSREVRTQAVSFIFRRVIIGEIDLVLELWSPQLMEIWYIGMGKISAHDSHLCPVADLGCRNFLSWNKY